MKTISVSLPPIRVDDMALKESDERILDATKRYMDVQQKSKEFLDKAEDRHLSGSPGTIYLKKKGHRALSAGDFENLVQQLGTPADKSALVDFALAQQELRDRLKDTRVIGLALEQAGLTNNLYYSRSKNPSLWKPEEVIKMIEVLERLRV